MTYGDNTGSLGKNGKDSFCWKLPETYEEKRDVAELVGVSPPILGVCDHLFGVGVIPYWLVNLDGVAVIRPPRGVALVPRL